MSAARGSDGISPEIARLSSQLMKDPKSKLFIPLAEEYMKEGMVEEAIMTLDDGLRYNSGYMSARVMLGKAYLNKGDVDNACVQFETVVKAVPDNLFAHKKLGEIYVHQGKRDEALKSYKILSMLNPSDEEAVSILRTLESGIMPESTLELPKEEEPQKAEAKAKAVPAGALAAKPPLAARPENAPAPEGAVAVEPPLVSRPEEEPAPEPAEEAAGAGGVEVPQPSLEVEEEQAQPVSAGEEGFPGSGLEEPVQTEGGGLPAEEEAVPQEEGAVFSGEEEPVGEGTAPVFSIDEEPAGAGYGSNAQEEMQAILSEYGEEGGPGEEPESGEQAYEMPEEVSAPDFGAEALEGGTAGDAEDIFAAGGEKFLSAPGDEEEPTRPAAGGFPFDTAESEEESGAPFDMSGMQTEAESPFDMSGMQTEAESPFDMSGMEEEAESPFDMSGMQAEEESPFDMSGMEAESPFGSAGEEAQAEEASPFDMPGVEAEAEAPFGGAGAEAQPEEASPFDMPGMEAEAEAPFGGAGAEAQPEEASPFDMPVMEEETVSPFGAAEVEAQAEEASSLGMEAVEESETAEPFGEVAEPESEASSKEPFSTESLAEMYIQQGFYDRAINIYKEMLAESPDDAGLKQKLEDLYVLVGMTSTARAEAAEEEAAGAEAYEPVDFESIPPDEPLEEVSAVHVSGEKPAPEVPAASPGATARLEMFLNNIRKRSGR